jgi:hypothetical protein
VTDPTAPNGQALAQPSDDRTDYRFPLAFYKGRREQLAGGDLKVSGDQWHVLARKAEGDRFTVSFDGNALFSAQDGAFQDVVKIALRTKADSVTYFDTISIVDSSRLGSKDYGLCDEGACL